jgi:hypothetical protein
MVMVLLALLRREGKAQHDIVGSACKTRQASRQNWKEESRMSTDE